MKKKLAPQFSDDRGEILDVLTGENIDAVTLITFTKGATRANHYHKETIQWNYVTNGKLIYASQEIGGVKKEITLSKGDFVTSNPNEIHAFKAIENSELLVLTKGPRAGKDYEEDTFRLEEPILK